MVPKKKYAWFLTAKLYLLGLFAVSSQPIEVVMPSNNNFPGFEVVINSCNASFYDSGGIDAGYGFAEDGKVTICPTSDDEVIRIKFDEVYIAGNDFLYIYDGNTDQDPIIATITDIVDAPSGFYYASDSNPSGCLTFVFQSSADYANYAGWNATIDCFDPCQELESSEFTLTSCGIDGSTIYNLTIFEEALAGNLQEVSFSYYSNLNDAQNRDNEISNPATFTSVDVERVYVVSTIGIGRCSVISTIDLDSNEVLFDTLPMSVDICMNDEILFSDVINLLNISDNQELLFFNSEQDQALGENALAVNDMIEQSVEVFYTLTNGADCSIDGVLQIHPYKLVIPDLRTTYLLCDDDTIYIDTGFDTDGYEFSWFLNGDLISDGNSGISIDEPGEYDVAIRPTGAMCESFFSFLVQSSRNLIDDMAVINEPFSRNISVITTPQQSEGLRTRLDDGDLSNNLIYNGLDNGIHTVTIYNSQDCLLHRFEFEIMAPHRYFSPNGDGYNDRWLVTNNHELLDIKNIVIYDRYGSIVHRMTDASTSWDGMLNGEPMPSSDYWFKIEYIMEGRTEEVRGHFALKR